jgi:cysteine protease ATG4
VYLLSARYDLPELRSLVTSRPWLTYRRDFPAIGGSGLTSDQGWGCMLRCGQMVLAGALLDTRLGRDWRWTRGGHQSTEYLEVMERFRDIKSAQYSIHQIALMGESVDGKPVGTWFGPNTVAQVLRKLCKYDPSDDMAVHVAMDNTLVINEVRETCLSPPVEPGGPPAWKPLLLFVSLRLGLTEINPVYAAGLKAALALPHTLGVIGGRPNHALYLIGVVEEEVIFLDPHTTQPATPEDGVEAGEVEEEADSSYHCPRPGRWV